MLADRFLTTIVFFLDETFEEVSFDICTSVQESTEQLAATIKLQNYATFTLFDCRKVRPYSTVPQTDIQMPQNLPL